MCDATTAAWALGSVFASEALKPDVPSPAAPPPAPPEEKQVAPMASPEKKSSAATARSNPLKIDLANPLTSGQPSSGLQIKL